MFPFVEDLAQAPAVQLLLCLLPASDHVLEVGQDHHQHKHTNCNKRRHLDHGVSGIHRITGPDRHGRLLQDLQDNVAHNRIGNHLMLIQQDPDDPEGGSWITGANLHRQQVGRFDGRSINRTVPRIHIQLVENVVSHNRAVQDLREHRGQAGGGIEIVIDRRGAVPGRQNQGRLAVIIGDVNAVRIDIGTHAAQDSHHQDQRPFLYGIPDKDDRVIGQQ